jgi:hypothetical protein
MGHPIRYRFVDNQPSSVQLQCIAGSRAPHFTLREAVPTLWQRGHVEEKRKVFFWVLAKAGARLVSNCERYEGQRVPAAGGHRAETTHDSMSDEFYIVTSCTLLTKLGDNAYYVSYCIARIKLVLACRDAYRVWAFACELVSELLAFQDFQDFMMWGSLASCPLPPCSHQP